MYVCLEKKGIIVTMNKVKIVFFSPGKRIIMFLFLISDNSWCISAHHSKKVYFSLWHCNLDFFFSSSLQNFNELETSLFFECNNQSSKATATD